MDTLPARAMLPLVPVGTVQFVTGLTLRHFVQP